FSDLHIPVHADDVYLNGNPVSHVEQADDVAIWSMSPEGLQDKLNHFFRWCQLNSMVISVKKTKWMLFGPLPPLLPIFLIDSKRIELVPSYKYVRLNFTSVHRYILQAIYNIKAGKARNVTHATFALEPAIGCLPPQEGITLYMARIDPHLIFGCKIVLDIDLTLLEDLENVQHLYLRRLLGVNRRSTLAFLFTELGIEPIRYRHIKLALSYLHSLLSLQGHRLVTDALAHSFHLVRMGQPAWISDLRNVLCHLPVPVLCTVDNLADPEALPHIIKEVELSCEESLSSMVRDSVKAHLLHNRTDYNEMGLPALLSATMSLCPYLKVLNVPKHRHAFTHLLLSCHCLSVERLRYNEWYRPPIPRIWRLCRFCRLSIEDECHALLQCRQDVTLVYLRERYLADIGVAAPELTLLRQTLSDYDFLKRLLFNVRVMSVTAKYVYDVLNVFSGHEPYVPSPDL
ncbi:hypothetical protein F5877DRAFT_16260, partial [Lentinula edodes]